MHLFATLSQSQAGIRGKGAYFAATAELTNGHPTPAPATATTQ
jgi:hypothetical protein